MYSRETMLALATELGTEARIAYTQSVAFGQRGFDREAWCFATTARDLATRAAHFAAGALGPEDEAHEPEVPFRGEFVDYD